MGKYSILRPYQERAIQDCVDILTSKKKKCMEVVVAPTAAGKSLYISNTVNRLGIPILVLQPSKELLAQNYEKFTSIGGVASICCASLKTKTLDRVDYTEINGTMVPCKVVSKITYATVGSVKAYAKELKKLGVTRAIIDECHLSTKSGSQIRELFSSLGITHVVGLTATPVYLDGGLDGAVLKMITRVRGKLFSTIRSVTQISELVENKYWTKLVYQVNKTDESFLEHNTSGSDYTVKSLSEYYKANNLEDRIIEEVRNMVASGSKSILVFVSTIEEADGLYKKYPNSLSVHSKMRPQDRDYAVKAFKEMTVPVVFNVGVLATGFDHPELDGIITARATSSIAIYYQQIGRGVRIHKDKSQCRVVDFSGNVLRFGPVEGLHYEEVEGFGWGMFDKENRLLTGHPISALTRPTKDSLKREPEPGPVTGLKMWLGKYKGKELSWVVEKDKGYAAWMYDNFDFNTEHKKRLKRELERLLRLPKTL